MKQSNPDENKENNPDPGENTNNDLKQDGNGNNGEKVEKSENSSDVGIDEKLRTLKNKRTSALANVTRKKNNLVNLMAEFENLHEVKIELREFNRKYLLYEDAHTTFVECLEDEQQETEESRFTSKQTSIIEFRKQVQIWVRKAEMELADELDSASRESRTSRHSKADSNTSIKSARLMAKAKVAELLAEKSMLREKQALENQKQSLMLSMELAKAKAREEALGPEDGMNDYLARESGKVDGLTESRDNNPKGVLIPRLMAIIPKSLTMLMKFVRSSSRHPTLTVD